MKQCDQNDLPPDRRSPARNVRRELSSDNRRLAKAPGFSQAAHCIIDSGVGFSVSLAELHAFDFRDE